MGVNCVNIPDDSRNVIRCKPNIAMGKLMNTTVKKGAPTASK